MSYEYISRRSELPGQVVLETELPGQQNDRVMFVRGGATRHPCPICGNYKDISRMGVYDRIVRSILIYWCPEGHIYYATEARVVALQSFFREPFCPICKDVRLVLDVQAMMEQYGEQWELEMRVIHEDEVPYTCDKCGQEGTLEDFRLMQEADNADTA